MKEILNEYVLKITTFTDGSIETSIVEEMKEIKLKGGEALDINVFLNDCSERIKQSLMVILEISRRSKNMINNSSLPNYLLLYNEAINSVSENLNVAKSTVMDKMQRQMQKTADDVKILVKNFFEQKDDSLKKLLIDNVGIHTSDVDKMAIEKVFEII